MRHKKRKSSIEISQRNNYVNRLRDSMAELTNKGQFTQSEIDRYTILDKQIRIAAFKALAIVLDVAYDGNPLFDASKDFVFSHIDGHIVFEHRRGYRDTVTIPVIALTNKNWEKNLRESNKVKIEQRERVELERLQNKYNDKLGSVEDTSSSEGSPPL